MGKDVLRKRSWPILCTVPVLSDESGGGGEPKNFKIFFFGQRVKPRFFLTRQ